MRAPAVEMGINSANGHRRPDASSNGKLRTSKLGTFSPDIVSPRRTGELNGIVTGPIKREIAITNPGGGTLIPGEISLGRLSFQETKHFLKINDGLPSDTMRLRTVAEITGGSAGIAEMLGGNAKAKTNGSVYETRLEGETKMTVYEGMGKMLLVRPSEGGKGSEMHLLPLDNTLVRQVVAEDGTRAFDLILPPVAPKASAGEDPDARTPESVRVIRIDQAGSHTRTLRTIDFVELSLEDKGTITRAMQLKVVDKVVAEGNPTRSFVNAWPRDTTDGLVLEPPAVSEKIAKDASTVIKKGQGALHGSADKILELVRTQAAENDYDQRMPGMAPLKPLFFYPYHGPNAQPKPSMDRVRKELRNISAKVHTEHTKRRLDAEMKVVVDVLADKLNPKTSS